MHIYVVTIIIYIVTIIVNCYGKDNDDPFLHERDIKKYTGGIVGTLKIRKDRTTLCTCGKQEGYDGAIERLSECSYRRGNESILGYCGRRNGVCSVVLYADENDANVFYRKLGCMKQNLNRYSAVEMKLFCVSSYTLSKEYIHFCCNDRDFCNNKINRTLNKQLVQLDHGVSNGTITMSNWQIGLIIVCGVLMLMMISFIILIIKQRRAAVKRLNVPMKDTENGPLISQHHHVVYGLSEMVDDMLGCDNTSGSGSGLPLLAQRTLARQITLEDKIGEGSFGFVHRGRWRGEYVAVKIFQSKDEDSWYNESSIYQVCYLRHENILGFFAADTKDARLTTELWLVVEYHRNGSLYDYLKTHTVNIDTMFKMITGIASGLSHLHMDIHGTLQKPLLAHRDLKSKNIFVKNDLNCCIGDMGLAAIFDKSQNPSIQLPKNGTRCGTIRYQAPEILSLDHSEIHEFECLQRGDIYSTGLIFWEVMRRTIVNGITDSFEVAYYEHVTQDPTNEEMYKLVADDKKRPTISNRWSIHPVLSELCLLMKECWADNPYARLSALRIKKTLAELGCKIEEGSDGQSKTIL